MEAGAVTDSGADRSTDKVQTEEGNSKESKPAETSTDNPDQAEPTINNTGENTSSAQLIKLGQGHQITNVYQASI